MDKETKGMFEQVLNMIGIVDKRMKVMETRQEEIFNVVKSIEHSNQVHKAEIDNVNIRLAYAEGTLNAVSDAFDKRKVV